MSIDAIRFTSKEGSFKVGEAHPLHDGYGVQKLLDQTIPDAYASDEYGYSPEQIAKYLETQRGHYITTMSQACAQGSIYFIAADGLYFNRTRSVAESRVQGLCKTTPNTELGALEIEEMLVDPEYQSKGRGRALLSVALQQSNDTELVCGRVLGYNERALALAALLGMEKIHEAHGWPFPRKRSITKPFQRPPEWSYYGVDVATIKERLAETQ